MAEVFEIRHAGLFAGLGAGARGFNQARPDIGAARATFREIGRTLLLAWTGQTFALSSTPIWVRDVAIAIALPGEVRQ